MTRLEAIEHLKSILIYSCYQDGYTDGARTALDMAIEALKANGTDINVGSTDAISRQAAIDALDCINGVEEVLRSLPSVQPEIIRCKDCKYYDENWRRVSVRWLPCMDMRTGSNWYCGSAERREE